MKWRSVQPLKWVLGLLTIMAIAGAVAHFNQDVESTTPEFKSELQIGLYDLKLHRKEIYDADVKTVDGSLKLTITSPDDKRFILRGIIERQRWHNGQHFYSYTPIFYSSPSKGLMVDEMIDLLTYGGFLVHPKVINGKSLIVSNRGMIFLHSFQ